MTRDDLWPYQRSAVAAAVSNAACGDGLALFLEPGDGKTVATLTALRDLDAFPALVVAPAQVVAADVWGREARAWGHLGSLVVQPVVGSPAERVRLLGGPSPGRVEVISYENLLWLTGLGGGVHPLRHRAVIFDELSKMKAPGTRRFRRMRALFAKYAPLRLGLTGTPVGNHLLDLWGELFMVAGEAPLGPTFTGYRDRWFAPIDYHERVWRLKCCADCTAVGRRGRECKADWTVRCPCHARAVKDIKRAIAPFVFQRPASAPKRSPEVRAHPIVVPMPEKLVRISRDLMRQLWAEVGPGVEIEALQASALANKLRQLAGGACYTGREGEEGTWEEGLKEWTEVHDAKLRALDDLLDELQGEPVLVYYWFQHEAARIKRRLSGKRWANATDSGALDAWNRGELEVLLAHPQSTGFGLNLQGGGHHVAWYSLPWSGELWRQGNARVARPGQRAPWVTAHQFLCGPADERVAAVLAGKLTMERMILDA